MKTRCTWVNLNNPLYVDYHDNEWGRPVRDDQKLFEFLSLEGAQAGLSWETVLNKRENYRTLFHDFAPHKLVSMKDKELNEILKNPGIIRNRLKVFSIRSNAEAYFEVANKFGTFSNYLWSFVGGEAIANNWEKDKDRPNYTENSNQMSKDLKKRGFRFVGTTICYSLMQAAGLVQDHTKNCFCHPGNR